jgi:hypothetical protein
MRTAARSPPRAAHVIDRSTPDARRRGIHAIDGTVLDV